MSDKLAQNVFTALVKDFRLLLGEGFAENALKAFSAGPREFRDYVFPTLGEVPVLRYKAYWQLQNIFKRYTFENDVHDTDSLKLATNLKYVAFQEKRAVYHPFRMSTRLVLQEARRVCKTILSQPFDLRLFARNGKRAALGVPLKDAYLDGKWGDPSAFTCPSALKDDLLKEVDGDIHLRRIFKRLLKRAKAVNKHLNLSADQLALALVPKSWKTDRPITPLSVFGLFWSFGLGGYVEECLRISGMDISSLQELHKKLAQLYSVTRSHVTADLTSASDSIRSDIQNAVLPRWFYVELRKTFARTVLVDGVETYTESCLPMGNGATFPVETLIFYCLIRAVGNLLKVNGKYSVYGDDLIYPRKIHSYVCDVFNDLGIGVNAEKTFATSHFRESCGGDYYHGVDVRPMLFPAERMPTEGKLRKAQYLYKVLNTLLKRWDKSEIPGTYRLLLNEITWCTGKILQVPMSFPDTSGYRVDVPFREDWLHPFVFPKRDFANGSARFHIKFIGNQKPATRLVLFEDIYMWDKFKPDVVRYVDPPIQRATWARYTCPGMTRELANWFLKTVRFKDGEATPHGVKARSEPLHGEGAPKVNVSQLPCWT